MQNWLPIERVDNKLNLSFDAKSFPLIERGRLFWFGVSAVSEYYFDSLKK